MKNFDEAIDHVARLNTDEASVQENVSALQMEAARFQPFVDEARANLKFRLLMSDFHVMGLKGIIPWPVIIANAFFAGMRTGMMMERVEPYEPRDRCCTDMGTGRCELPKGHYGACEFPRNKTL